MGECEPNLRCMAYLELQSMDGFLMGLQHFAMWCSDFRKAQALHIILKLSSMGRPCHVDPSASAYRLTI